MFDMFASFDTSLLQTAYFKPLLVMLLSCLLILPALERLRISPVLGYLLAGMVVGPYGLALVSHSAGLEDLADLGVVFLLFMIGLKISWSRMLAMKHLVFQLGLLQVAISAAIIGFVAYQWEHSLQVTILLAVGFALSSTAIVSQMLMENHDLNSRKGSLTMAILLAQDLAVVPLLVMAKVFADEKTADLSTALGHVAIKAALAIVFIIVVGRYILRPLFEWLHSISRTPEIVVALSLLTIFATAALTSLTGLSMELGAFMAGLLLAESTVHDRIEKDIKPFQGLLLGLFFITVGMHIDYISVIDQIGWLVLSVIGLAGIKAVVIVGLGKIFKIPFSITIPSALLLAQGSEFVFVIVGFAMVSGLMPAEVGHFMLLVTALSMLATPVYSYLSRRAEHLIPSDKGGDA